MTLTGAVAIALALGACADTTATETKVPPEIAAVSGDGQTGEVQRPLGQALVVAVTDVSGRPQPNVTVSWAVAAGGGGLSAATTSTGADGRASVSYTLGANPGENRVTASVAGATASPVTFRVTALARGGIAAFVADTDANPIGGVRLHLRPAGSTTDLRNQLTDASGMVGFADVPGGPYDVLIDVPPGDSLLGPNPDRLTVQAGATGTVTFILKHCALICLARDGGTGTISESWRR